LLAKTLRQVKAESKCPPRFESEAAMRRRRPLTRRPTLKTDAQLKSGVTDELTGCGGNAIHTASKPSTRLRAEGRRLSMRRRISSNPPTKEIFMSNLRLLDPSFSDNFESALRRFFAPVNFDADTPALQMRIDVREKDDAYEVKADIPGVKKEDISVRIDGNLVQIDAEVKREKETKGDGDRVLRSERYYGTVSRTFSLADDVDDGKARASYADGVLTLALPKKATAASKKLVID
jgi:HSP20 family protein